MDAGLPDREIHVDRMDQTAVVPEHDVAEAPRMMILILRLDHALVEPVQERVAFALREADDPVRPVGVEVDRLLAGLFMNAHQRMHRVLGFVLLPFRKFGRRRQGAPGLVAVYGV